MVKTAREKIVEQVLKELPSAKLDPKLVTLSNNYKYVLWGPVH